MEAQETDESRRYLEIAQLLEPLIVAGFVLELGHAGGTGHAERGRRHAAPARLHLGHELGPQRLERRRLARHEREERAHVVD